MQILRGAVPPLPATFSSSLHALVEVLLAREPSQRPSIHDVLQMPYVQHHLARLAHGAVGALPAPSLMQLSSPSGGSLSAAHASSNNESTGPCTAQSHSGALTIAPRVLANSGCAVLLPPTMRALVEPSLSPPSDVNIPPLEGSEQGLLALEQNRDDVNAARPLSVPSALSLHNTSGHMPTGITASSTTAHIPDAWGIPSAQVTVPSILLGETRGDCRRAAEYECKEELVEEESIDELGSPAFAS